jgi:hypothetical protein
MLGKKTDAYRLLLRTEEGKEPLGRPRCRSEGSIKMDLQEIGGMVWTGLV